MANKTHVEKFLATQPGMEIVTTANAAADSSGPSAPPGPSSEELKKWGRRNETSSDSTDDLRVRIADVADVIRKTAKHALLNAFPGTSDCASKPRPEQNEVKAEVSSADLDDDSDVIQIQAVESAADLKATYGPLTASVPKNPKQRPIIQG